MNFLNLGTDKLDHVEASKVFLTNVITLITVTITSFYSLYYHFFLHHAEIAIFNFIFVIAYLIVLVINYLGAARIAKTWLFIVLMAHFFVFSRYIFSIDAGVHFYYWSIPPGVFLLFNEKDKLEKPFICIVATLLFVFCEYNENLSPIIPLAEDTEKTILISVGLVTIIHIYIAMSIMSRRIDRYQQELNQQATTDALTGVFNRRMLMVIGDELIASAKRYQQSLSLLILDLDHFKKINDQFGHLAGDKALQEVANTLKSKLRDSDCIARYGGEEFVVILPHTDLSKAKSTAETLRAAIANCVVPLSEDKLTFTTSIGVAALSTHTLTISDLIKEADLALYQAKENGRNQVICHQN
ncbi:GGDEF domain-containing protein [Thalassotalea ganghwensis]